MEITLNIGILFLIGGSNFLCGLFLGHLVGKFNERRAWNQVGRIGP